MPLRRIALLTAVLGLALPACAAIVAAQEKDRDAEAKAAYAHFRDVAEGYRLARSTGAPLPLHPEPLLNWGNPVRQRERGSLFVWTRDGRPAAMGSIFTYELNDGSREKHEFHSLCEERLRLALGDRLVWTPAPGITWRDAAGLASPAASDRQRMTQMRNLARTFQVRLVDHMGDATQLRMMPQPLFRYVSPGAGVIDGAIFSYVVATDPEALLLVEAAGTTASGKWRYAFARFHYWQLDATDASGAVVWSAEADLSQALHQIGDAAHMEKPYVSFHPAP